MSSSTMIRFKARTITANEPLAIRLSAADATRFLVELANLSDEGKALNRFKRRFRGILENSVPKGLVRHWWINTAGDEYDPERSEEVLEATLWLLPLRNTLQRIWRAPDSRTKDWGVFMVCRHFFGQGDGSLLTDPPLADTGDGFLRLRPPSLCEQAFLHLPKIADLMKYCANPECPAPYFIAARRSQKYCSAVCSEPALRESKRRWWVEYGEDRRSKRSNKRARKRNRP
jgi:hypothetical protein